MTKIIKILLLAILLFSIASLRFVFAQESRFYYVELIYDKGTLGLKNITVLPGAISAASQEGDYRYELISFPNSILSKDTFPVPKSIIAEEFDLVKGTFTSKEQTIDKLDFSINIPYFDNGKTINIYDPKNAKILGISVEEFSQFCGNKMCGINEDYSSCPQDCPLTSQEKAQKTAQSKNSFKTAIIILSSPISIVLLMAIIYWIIKRRKKANAVQ